MSKKSVQKTLRRDQNTEVTPMRKDEYLPHDMPATLRKSEEIRNVDRFDAPFASIQQAGTNGGIVKSVNSSHPLPKSHPFPGLVAVPRLQTFGQ